MTPPELAVQEAVAGTGVSRIVNDFSIQVATVNGSGSQTANLVLLRSIFQMGVPVSGKNLFPSNIAGLPTWYTIRASKDGWVARKKELDLLVAMNPETAAEDVAALRPGTPVVYDAPLALQGSRSDLGWFPVPFDELVGHRETALHPPVTGDPTRDDPGGAPAPGALAVAGRMHVLQAVTADDAQRSASPPPVEEAARP